MRDYKDLKSEEVIELEKKERNHNTDIKCKCGGHMIIRVNKNNSNKFLGCSNYPKCNNTLAFSVQKAGICPSGLYNIGRAASQIDTFMRYDAEMYGYDSDDDHSWGTGGGIYCHDDM